MSENGRAEQILDAAERRMRRGGYHAVSFRDLAADIGIRSASIHHHFPQKEDLGVAVVERYRTRFLAVLDEHGASRPDATKLQVFCAAYRRALAENDTICLCGMLGAESNGLPERVVGAVREFFAANITWVVAALPVDTARAARERDAASIVAGLQGAMILAGAMADPGILDATIERLLRAHGSGPHAGA